MKLFPGDITGLIGPNGCGKTTIFNMINGFLQSDRGAVYVRGEEVTGLAPYKLVNKGLARSWQDVRVFKGMTVLDNVLVARPNQTGENLFLLFSTPDGCPGKSGKISGQPWSICNLWGSSIKRGNWREAFPTPNRNWWRSPGSWQRSVRSFSSTSPRLRWISIPWEG